MPRLWKVYKKISFIMPLLRREDYGCPGGAKTMVAPDKGGFICRNCGKKVPQKNIRPNKKDNISVITHCPYCGIKI